MKWRLTPIGIISMFLIFILAQGSTTFTANVAPAATDGITWQARDTVPENPRDSTKKKKKKKDKDKDRDRDTTHPHKPDTFKTFRP